MNRTAFWKLIESTRPDDSDYEQHVQNLTARLQEMAPEEIAAFENHVSELKDEAYDVRVLEVLWILTGGGPGDEGWTCFTNWLILQGSRAFQQVLKSPERLPELYPPGTEIFAHGLDHAAMTAYEEAGGQEDFWQFYERLHGPHRMPDAPRGAKHDPRTEDEDVLTERLRKKYPNLWEYEAQYD